MLALGVRAQINRSLHERGMQPRYKHGKRVTDALSMQAASAAAAAVRSEVEARLSRVRACPGCGFKKWVMIRAGVNKGSGGTCAPLIAQRSIVACLSQVLERMWPACRLRSP